ncbi:MAG: hypothetical protein IID42_08625 [Planctomycetes bacterium]|nr:hypothetical protein [Planctomycetota bacterium]
MLKNLAMMMSLAFVYAGVAPVSAGGCKGCTEMTRAGHGSCCGKSMAFGVQLTSQKLYDALAGRTVTSAEAGKCPCSDCKKASSGKGGCDRCQFTGGKLYSSGVAYALAKGQPMPAELVAACPKRCDQCKIAHKANGRCDKCGVGFVADRMFEKEADYKAALEAYKTLKKAATTAKKCEHCAVAMVTDGSCTKCKVKFENGRVASAG